MKEVGAEISREEEVEKIIESLLQEARNKAEEIIKEAKTKAEEIIKDAEKRAERMKEAKRRELERILKDELAKRSSAVEVRIKREILTMQKRYLDLLFEKVRQQLALIAENKIQEWNYEEILKKYALEALERLNTQAIYIWGREKDVPLLRKIAKELNKEAGVNLQVDTSRTALIVGGLIARDDSDSRRFYNTFEGRLSEYRERNEPRIIEMLFGGSDE